MRNAARNEGVPFFELPALSPIRVMEVLAPLMGEPIPPHLLELRRDPNAQQYLPPLQPGSTEAAALRLLAGTQVRVQACVRVCVGGGVSGGVRVCVCVCLCACVRVRAHVCGGGGGDASEILHNAVYGIMQACIKARSQSASAASCLRHRQGRPAGRRAAFVVCMCPPSDCAMLLRACCGAHPHTHPPIPQSLQQYMASRPLPPAAATALHLDDVDGYDTRRAMLPANPQQREGTRHGRLVLPHMPGSRKARIRVRQRQEADSAATW